MRIKRYKTPEGVNYRDADGNEYKPKEYWNQYPSKSKLPVPFNTLSKSEKISFIASKRLRVDNKFISKDAQNRVESELKKLKQIDKLEKSKDLDDLFDIAQVRDLMNGTREYYTNTEAKLNFNVIERVTNLMNAGRPFTYVARNGKKYLDKDGLIKLIEDMDKKLEELQDEETNPILLYKINDAPEGVEIDFQGVKNVYDL